MRVFQRPIPIDAALTLVESWLERSNVMALVAGQNRWSILRSLISGTGSAGNLTTDAHLAALAIERGYELCSTDSDVARFAGLN